jgi:hypothetical protein
MVCSLVRQYGLGRGSRIARSLKRRAFKIAFFDVLPFGPPWQRKLRYACRGNAIRATGFDIGFTWETGYTALDCVALSGSTSNAASMEGTTK